MRRGFFARSISLILCTLYLCGSVFADEPPFALIQSELAKVRQVTEGSLPRLLKESRLLFWQGKYTSGVEDKIKLLTQAQQLVEEAGKLDPKNPEWILGWVASEGELLQLISKLAAFPRIRRLEKRALELQALAPEFQFYAADRILGRIYQVSPRFFSIGSPTRAREHFEVAMKNAPDFPGNQVFYADFLFEQNEKTKAKELAQKVLSSPMLAQYPLERFDWVQTANQILK
jgi:tetratricopeptide (TPR) repeat protein